MILITGINGFVGRHLAREFASRGLDIFGVGHREKEADITIASLLESYFHCDITNPELVADLPLENVNAVINLAGLANAGASFDNPELYMKVNVEVLSVLGDALLKANPKARMIAVSTGALYDPNQEMPISEDANLIEKGSPYAESKLAMEKAASELRDKGQDCVIVRPFNHIGPGQGLGFLIPDLANKLKSTDPENPRITAGNLKTIRDYTDVRDIAKAYAELATSENLNNSLYNVCSGAGYSGEDIVKSLCDELGVDFSKLQIDVDQSLIRPKDPPRIVGDNSRLKADTGWQPETPLSTTVSDIIKELS